MTGIALLDQYGWRLLDGLVTTGKLVGLSCFLGFILAYPIALARRSRRLALSLPARGLIACFRGTPLLCQTYLVYYGAGELRPFLSAWGVWPFFREAFFCCVLTFSLNTACYQAEIIRGALASVPKGQTEAAKALGLSRYRTARHVVWPQAALMLLRPLGNELIGMVKASAIAAVVTMLDLMGQTRLIYARSFDFSIYLYAAVLYLLVTEAISRVVRRLERGLSAHLHARGPAVMAAVPKRTAAAAALGPAAVAQPH
jgi:polar amino acid transport system permease protein